MMGNSIYQQDLVPQAGKEYKLFLVEVDDEDRERVLSARVRRCEITAEPEYADIHVDYSDFSVRRFMTHEEVTAKMELVPSENGTYFEIVDFSKEDEDEGSE